MPLDADGSYSLGLKCELTILSPYRQFVLAMFPQPKVSGITADPPEELAHEQIP